MKTKPMHTALRLLAVLAIAGLWLAGAAPVFADNPAAQSEKEGNLQVNVQLGADVQPEALALFDKDWKMVKEVQPSGASYTFRSLKPGSYHVMAYLDAMMIGSKGEVAVRPGQTAYRALNTRFAYSVAAKNSTALDWGNSYECVSSWGNGAKITAYCLGPVIGWGGFLGNPTTTYVTFAKVCGPVSGGGRSHPPAYIPGCAKVPVIACIPGHCK